MAGGVDHAVLGGKADRGGGHGRDGQAGGGVAEPRGGRVVRQAGFGLAAGWVGGGWARWGGQGQQEEGWCLGAAGEVAAEPGAGDGGEREGHDRLPSGGSGKVGP